MFTVHTEIINTPSVALIRESDCQKYQRTLSISVIKGDVNMDIENSVIFVKKRREKISTLWRKLNF